MNLQVDRGMLKLNSRVCWTWASRRIWTLPVERSLHCSSDTDALVSSANRSFYVLFRFLPKALQPASVSNTHELQTHKKHTPVLQVLIEISFVRGGGGLKNQYKIGSCDVLIIIILTSIFFQDQSRVWTAASKQHMVNNQPLVFSHHKAVVYPWKYWSKVLLTRCSSWSQLW